MVEERCLVIRGERRATAPQAGCAEEALNGWQVVLEDSGSGVKDNASSHAS